jgi:hypothetical protein
MNNVSWHHGRPVLQFRSPDQTSSSASNDDARSSANLRSIDRSPCNAPAPGLEVARDTKSAQSLCPSSTPVLRSQGHSDISSALRAVSTTTRSTPMASGFMMHITIGAESVTALRQIVISTFGETVAFMRIQSIDHATKMKVCLCLTGPIVNRVMEAIMHALPSAEFGRVSPA